MHRRRSGPVGAPRRDRRRPGARRWATGCSPTTTRPRDAWVRVAPGGVAGGGAGLPRAARPHLLLLPVGDRLAAGARPRRARSGGIRRRGRPASPDDGPGRVDDRPRRRRHPLPGVRPARTTWRATSGITLKADVGDGPTVRDGAPRAESWVPLFRGADWHEREAWEMFGIEFVGHPDLAPHLPARRVRGLPAAQGLPAAGPRGQAVARPRRRRAPARGGRAHRERGREPMSAASRPSGAERGS